MVKMAAIDLGSNSIRLLVTETDNLRLKPLLKDLRTTRLGTGVSKNGVLSRKAMEKTLEAVRDFKEKAISMGAGDIIVIATSAVRDAANREGFIGRIRELGLEVKTLGGEEEAELGFLGAVSGLKDINSGIFLVDIGGRSTELVLGKKAGVERSKSLELGAVRLTESFAEDDPVNMAELERIEHSVMHKIIQDTKDIAIGDAEMIGIGGTITTLAAIAQGMEEYDPPRIHNYILNRTVIEDIFKELLRLNIEQRQKIPGLQPERADIIVAGTIILKSLMEHWGFERLTVSEWDNLEGAIYQNLISVHENSCTIPTEKT
jgi:exopolyphosphatase/guanosine-5'-triphosphate,3'-diphosphate pyrophosphatase